MNISPGKTAVGRLCQAKAKIQSEAAHLPQEAKSFLPSFATFRRLHFLVRFLQKTSYFRLLFVAFLRFFALCDITKGPYRMRFLKSEEVKDRLFSFRGYKTQVSFRIHALCLILL